MKRESTNQSYVGRIKNGKVIFPSMIVTMATKVDVIYVVVGHHTKITTFKCVHDVNERSETKW